MSTFSKCYVFWRHEDLFYLDFPLMKGNDNPTTHGPAEGQGHIAFCHDVICICHVCNQSLTGPGCSKRR